MVRAKLKVVGLNLTRLCTMSDRLAALPPLLPIQSNRPDRITACGIAQVGKSTIYKMIADGRVRAVNFGTRMTRIETESLLQALGLTTPAE